MLEDDETARLSQRALRRPSRSIAEAAARSRRALRRGGVAPGHLAGVAADGDPHAGARAHLRRHLFRASARPGRPGGAASTCWGRSSGASTTRGPPSWRRGRELLAAIAQGRAARGGWSSRSRPWCAPRCVALWRARDPVEGPIGSQRKFPNAPLLLAELRLFGASAGGSTARGWSTTCGAHPHADARPHAARRGPRSPRPAPSTATPRTAPGTSPTSRRRSTTTPSSQPSTSEASRALARSHRWSESAARCSTISSARGSGPTVA